MSIILPTYNRAALLPSAIGSVFNQTFQDLELIVWDDGSTDETAAYIQSLSDPRINYYYSENHGAAYARNRGIAQAQGRYLAFLDSDDAWHTDKLSRQVAILESHPEIDFLFTDFLNINLAKEKEVSNFQAYQSAMGALETFAVEEHLFVIQAGFLKCLTRGNFIATDTVLLRRRLFDQLEPFNETLRNSEDFELWWRMGLAGCQFAYLDQVLMRRYKPIDSLSSLSVASIQSQLKALDLCSEAAILRKRQELLTILNQPYRNAWHNMITAYALEGDRQGMLVAFRQSLRFGFRPGALRLLLAGFMKPCRIISKQRPDRKEVA